jgi:hypothetical protein
VSEAAALTALAAALRARGVPRAAALRFVLGHAAGWLAAARGLAAGPRPALPLRADEAALLATAASAAWAAVPPRILGGLFEACLSPARRRTGGVHFTDEAAVMRVVEPTIVAPWRRRIAAADAAELERLRDELAAFTVLDPACGCGDFLAATLRALAGLERELLARLGTPAAPLRVSPRQLFGIDRDPRAVALAHAVLRLTARDVLADGPGAATGRGVPVDGEDPGRSSARGDVLRDRSVGDVLRDRSGGDVPGDRSGGDVPGDRSGGARGGFGDGWEVGGGFDSGAGLRVGDALFVDWPRARAIVGNPPFLAKNRLQRALGVAYVQRLRAAYPEVPGLADYCVYWFRRAHDELPAGGRAGLVGTNTVRQNSSRAGGLGHIVAGGTIVDAVASAVWPGDAQVHVSIVNWVKGPAPPGPRRLAWQDGDGPGAPWRALEVAAIGPSLSPVTEVAAARPLRANLDAGGCFQGQTPGHAGFVVDDAEARAMLAADPANAAVLRPWMIADDLLGGGPRRWVIDFGERSLAEARAFARPFARVEATVLPARAAAAAAEARRNAGRGGRTNRHHAQFLARWWLLAWRRPALLAAIAGLPRYVACARVGRRPIFAFVDAAVRPGDALVVFPFADDYSFGVLQSRLHAAWALARGSTLKRDARYTSSTVFAAFPWPQAPTPAQRAAVADAAAAVLAARGGGLRALYRTGGSAALRAAHGALDAAAAAAYGFAEGDELAQLLALNERLAAREAAGEAVVGPGAPTAACQE